MVTLAFLGNNDLSSAGGGGVGAGAGLGVGGVGLSSFLLHAPNNSRAAANVAKCFFIVKLIFRFSEVRGQRSDYEQKPFAVYSEN